MYRRDFAGEPSLGNLHLFTYLQITKIIDQMIMESNGRETNVLGFDKNNAVARIWLGEPNFKFKKLLTNHEKGE